MTTDWSKTWAGANGWYDGYDSTNTGSFVDISTLSGAQKDAAIKSVRENIIGLLEQKGVTRAQIMDPTSDVGKFYTQQMANAASGSDNATKDAFQAAAQHTTSAIDRGDKWGSDTDDSMGRSYLDTIAAGGTASISDLYTSGFGRTESQMADDQAGLNYWQAELDSGNMTIQQIAQAFSESEEANIRDVYSDEYGRDIRDEGLNYWRDHAIDSDGAAALTASLGAQDETAIRTAGWEYLGQASSQDQRATMPNLGGNQLFTDMETDQVIDWIEQIRAGTMTLDDLTKKPDYDSEGKQIAGTAGLLYDRGDRMDAHNQYNVDDWDDDGAQPTGMGQFASLQEIQATIDSGMTPDDIRKKLATEKWGALTHEKLKVFGEHGTSDDLYDQTKYFDSFKGKMPSDGTNYTGQGDWKPTVPTKPGIPGKMPVDKRQIEYMPNQQADQFSSTPYGAAKQEFDAEQSKIKAPTQPLAAQQVGKRFTGTSAKGVKMKRSKASMGTVRGTERLTREQQTKSLNI